MRVLVTIALLVFLPAVAVAQSQLDSLTVPGGVPAARRILDLGDPEGRPDAYWLLDYVLRFHGTGDEREGVERAVRYFSWHAELATELGRWPEGFQLATGTGASRNRPQSGAFLELLGLRLTGNPQHVVEANSRDARERREWLTALGQPSASLIEALNDGKGVRFAFPHSVVPIPAKRALERMAPGTPLFIALIERRQMGLLYSGLMAAPPSTRGYLEARPELFSSILEHHAGVFAAFGASIKIVNGGVDTPGGPSVAADWEFLVGAAVAEPDRFLPLLLGKDRGRLAYFFHTAATLDTPRQRALLRPDLAASARRTHFGRVYTAFDRWDVSDRPFSRPALDPALVLALTPVAQSDQVAPSWWPAMLTEAAGARPQPGPRAGEEIADAAWLLNWIFADPSHADSRFRMFRFAHRIAADAAAASAPDLRDVLAAAKDLPTLMPALERMGVRDLSLLADMSRAARRADHPRWQAMLALVEQIQLRRRLPESQLTPLLKSLAQLTDGSSSADEGRYGAYLIDTLLPVVAPKVSLDKLETLERDVVLAITQRADATRIPVFFEGLDYVLDDSFATARDVLTMRAVRAVPTLGEVVRLSRMGRQVDSGLATLAGLDAFKIELVRARAALAILPRINGKEPEAVGRFKRVTRAFDNLEEPSALKDRQAIASTLRFALDAVAEATVVPLVYGLALSPAGKPAATLADLPWRHVWKYGDDGYGNPMPGPWSLARQSIGVVQDDIVSGSLLGLDVALSDVRLRPGAGSSRGDLRAHVSDEDGAGMRLAMRIHMESTPIDAGDARRVGDAMLAARKRLAELPSDPAGFEEGLREAGVDPIRAAMAAWPRLESGETEADHILMFGDFYKLGTDQPLPAPWAPQGVAAECSWIAADTTALVDREGSSEVMLRLADLARREGVSASVVPYLLPMVVHEWLTEVQQLGPDDHVGLTEWTRRLTPARVESYLLALVSARILGPKDVK